MFEEGLAGGQFSPDQPVAPVAVGQEGVDEVREHVHGGQQRGKVLFPMAEVVLQVVALGLECVVVLVLDLPSAPCGGDDTGDIFIVDPPVRDPGADGSRACR